jgi:hypothetical protein
MLVVVGWRRISILLSDECVEDAPAVWFRDFDGGTIVVAGLGIAGIDLTVGNAVVFTRCGWGVRDTPARFRHAVNS